MHATHTYIWISVTLKRAGIDIGCTNLPGMQTSCIPRVLRTENLLFSNSYSAGWEKVGIIHRTEESFTSTNTVTWCQVSYHVILFYGNWWNIGRRDYEVCSTFDGAVWNIPVQLNFPGSTEKAVVYTLLMHWHRSVLYCVQLCYTRVYVKHTSTIWQANRLKNSETVTEWLHQSWFYQKQSYNTIALNDCL